jgi:hypothetical protein
MGLRDTGLRGAKRPSLRRSVRRVGAFVSGLVVVAGTTIAFDASSLVQGSPPPAETLSCNDSWTGAGPTADWNSAGNWTAGVPNSTSVEACISGDAAVLLPDGSFSIGELTVSAGSSLAIGTGATGASLSVSSGLQNDGALTVGPTGTSGTTATTDPTATPSTSGQAGLTLDGPITNTGTLTVDGMVAIGTTVSTTVSNTTALSNDGTIGIAPGGQINMDGSSTITNEPDGLLAFGIDGPSSSVADYGRITDGTLSLAGSADPVVENGFTPSPNAEYFVDTGTSKGTFTSVLHGATADYTHPGEVGLTGGAPPVVTSTNLTSSVAAGSDYGQSVQFRASVTPTSGSNPTGLVSFTAGGLLLGSSVLTTSAAGVTSAVLDVSSLDVGSDSITATYVGDVVFGASTSAVLSQVVNPDPTTVTIASSSASPELGQPVTETATVSSAAPGSGTPTGSVSFSDAGSSIPTCQGLALPPASPLAVTCSQAYGTNGMQSITATYGGDANFATSTGSLAENVSPVSTKTTIVPSPPTSTSGQCLTLTATVTPTTGTSNPDGTVTFTDDGISLGASMLSTTDGVTSASMLVTTLPVGSDSVTASYSGGPGFVASSSARPASVMVSKATTTLGLLTSDNPSPAGQSVTFTATVFPITGSGETGVVTFFDNGTRIGTGSVVNGQATLSVTTLSAGDHRIAADYDGDSSFIGSSTTGPLSQLVGDPQQN